MNQEIHQVVKMSRLEKWVLALALGMTFLRVVLSAYLGLGDDEAYYWDWSRDLALSYYDHPAMTAWLIKLSTLIFGDTGLGVRFFGIVTNAATGALIWYLAQKLFDRTTAALAVFLYLLAPIFSLGGILMVPDAPMGTAWLGITILVWKILGEGDDRYRYWLWSGVLLGLGFLSKYTILLLAVSIVLLLLSEREWRSKLLQKGFWSAVVISAIFCLPIILWNVQYDWPSLKFHLHDRQTGGGGANFNRWGQYFASQAIALGPALFLMVLGTVVIGLRKFRDRRWRFLSLLALPTFAIFTMQALYAEFKPHWPAPAYTLYFIGVAEIFRQGFGLSSIRAKKWAQGVAAALVLLIFIPLNLVFHIGTFTPFIPKMAQLFAPEAPWDPKFDPTNDLYGWPEAVVEANRLRDEIVAQGRERPFLSSSRYQLVAQIAFVSGERVWRVIPGRDHYTFTQTPEALKEIVGCSSIYITDNRYERDPQRDGVFQQCEKQAPLNFERDGVPSRRFDYWYCENYFGF